MQRWRGTENTAKDRRGARGDSSRTATFFWSVCDVHGSNVGFALCLVISDAAFTHQIEGALFLSTPMSL
jgi:hypothetical protein